jgi:hypothetical protein
MAATARTSAAAMSHRRLSRTRPGFAVFRRRPEFTGAPTLVFFMAADYTAWGMRNPLRGGWYLTFISFGEKIDVGMRKLTWEENVMRKVKYVKPGVVGGSSVHPC